MSEWMAHGSKWGSADLPFLVTTLNKGLVRSVQKSMNPQQVIWMRWSLSWKKTQIHLDVKHISGKFSRDDKGRRKDTFFFFLRRNWMCVPRQANHCLCASSARRKCCSIRATRAARLDTVPMQNLPAAMQLVNLDLTNIPHTSVKRREEKKRLQCNCTVDWFKTRNFPQFLM